MLVVPKWLCCLWTCLAVICTAFGTFPVYGKSSTDGQYSRHVLTLVVDQSGAGNYTTIQSAVNSVPVNNRRWICIFVKAGTYREKVSIPIEKEFIYLKGEGKKKTNIVWDDHETVVQSATFTASAAHFFAKSISFVNTYNLPANESSNPRAPAVAAMIGGDMSSFYRCGFYSVQDTLWDYSGRHYFKQCTIVGAVDFIFGSGQSIYEKCTIGVTANALGPGLAGFITAQGRNNIEETNGFVFKQCKVVGNGETYLGRPWRPYARVLFYRTIMTDIVVSPGWDAWYSASNEDQLTFAEVGCSGPGSNMSGRVKWVKKLSREEVAQLTRMNFIGSERWIRNQPFSSILF